MSKNPRHTALSVLTFIGPEKQVTTVTIGGEIGMQLDDAEIDRILTIVQLLAQGADDRRLSPNRVHAKPERRGAYSARQR
jgi:hypothetical protein